MTRLRSGLVVPMPALEPVVGAHRNRWDPVAPLGARAHVTVLFPFVAPSAIDDTVTRRVRESLVGHVPFAVSFAEARRFPDDLLYLAPEPAAPFLALTEALHRAFPDRPPYGGQFETVIPHLTVAHHPEAPFDEIENELRGLLPVRTIADSVELWTEGDDDRWTIRSTFPLSAART